MFCLNGVYIFRVFRKCSVILNVSLSLSKKKGVFLNQDDLFEVMGIYFELLVELFLNII